MKRKILVSAGVLALTAVFTTANAAFIHVGTDLALGDGSGITYTIAGDIATNPQDNGGLDDLRYTSADGGSFTITFSSAVDLTTLNTEINQGVNFDSTPVAVDSMSVTADSGVWAYTAGTLLDLTSSPSDQDLGTGGDGDARNALLGLGTSTLSVESTRGMLDGAGGSIASGAPASQEDWGELSISGVTSITWTYSDETNYDGFRMDAVAAIPEPATLGMVAAFGGGIMFIRRRFMI